MNTPDPVSTDAPAVPPARNPARQRRLGTGLAIGYTVALVIATAGLRFVGESWWLTTAALYLPRILFALPLPLVALALLLTAPRRVPWLLPAPLALLLFPLMGLHVGKGLVVKNAQASRPTLRVLSYNISSGDYPRQVAQTIAAGKADLVLLQEWDLHEAADLAKLTGYHTHFDGQFGVLSRFPISEVQVPPPVTTPGLGARPAEFIRYRIETAAGPVTVFNVHPISPRDGLVKFGGPTLLGHSRRGQDTRDPGIPALGRNAQLRWRQVEAIAQAADAVAGPVIIAGDTNLPDLSRIYAQNLAGYRDGFAEVGRGFGYTFPIEHPWMRIDRILASAPVTFQRFDVLTGPGSDHLAIAAELTIRQ